MHYSFDEMVDMLLTLGECRRNSAAAKRLYERQFPNRQIPDRKTFLNIERRLRENGMFDVPKANSGRSRTVRSVELEEDILDAVEERPSTSTRILSRTFQVSRHTVHSTLQEQLLKPFHVLKCQELLPADPDARLSFCRSIAHFLIDNPNFMDLLMMTDECCFTRNGVTNVHNTHEWADVNPHAVVTKHFQRQFKINVWGGILGNYLIGPFELPARLNGETYLEFLRESLPLLLEEVPIQTRQNMWLMHDGAPPHFAVEVRRFLQEQYPGRWIGRGPEAPRQWPPRSPDLNTLDFFYGDV